MTKSLCNLSLHVNKVQKYKKCYKKMLHQSNRKDCCIIVSNRAIHFRYVSKEYTKQMKTIEEGLDINRKSFKLYNRNKRYFLFSCLFIFHQKKLLNIKECVCFVFIFLIFNLLLVCLLQPQQKRAVTVYKVFTSSDSMLSF